jgi:hypothetical protein
MSRRPGRPPLDATDPSTKVCLALPSKRYDRLYRAAAAARVSVPELIRRSLDGPLKYPNSDELKRAP